MKNNFWDIVVLSPHLDDAVLSLGSHIVKWKKEGKKVKVVTIFNKFGNGKNLPSYTKDYMNKSGFDMFVQFEHVRNKEDREAMKVLGVEYEHWGFVDGGFRGIYKNRESLLSGIIDSKDQILIKNINKKIKKIKTELLLIPYGVGGHIDHMIVKKATEKIKLNKKYFLENPYLWQNFNFIKLFWKIINAKNVVNDEKEKRIMLENYGSQYNLLVKNWKLFYEVVLE